jgi:hypothetical protein
VVSSPRNGKQTQKKVLFFLLTHNALGPGKPVLNDFGAVEGFFAGVYAEDFIAYADIEVFVAVPGSLVITVGGDDYLFAVGKADKLGDFPAGGGVPEFYGSIPGAGNNPFPVGAERYGHRRL